VTREGEFLRGSAANFLLVNLSIYCDAVGMKTLSVAEFKAKLSEVIEEVKNGEEVGVLYGKKHEIVGVFIPVSKYATRSPRKLGLLQKRGSFTIGKDFKITDEELL